MRSKVPPAILRCVMHWRPSGLQSGLLLHGPTGGFKTTMLWHLARRVIEDGVRTAWMNSETLAREAAVAYGDPSRTAAWLADYKRPGWLFIDELFKGSFTPSAASAIFEIIEYRTTRLLPTVAATNATRKRIAASARDPAAQEAVAPILRRIIGEPGRPGSFECIHIPAPVD